MAGEPGETAQPPLNASLLNHPENAMKPPKPFARILGAIAAIPLVLFGALLAPIIAAVRE
ncbi:hypothetical protein [Nocardia sp. NPDC004860]|uniref:hypothetical protein n=1 Tax=Nocardia sp. NPDC004860 TaxID=3154557 RepID=UPI0033B12B9F